jgi:hypothetical protein
MAAVPAPRLWPVITSRYEPVHLEKNGANFEIKENIFVLKTH